MRMMLQDRAEKRRGFSMVALCGGFVSHARDGVRMEVEHTGSSPESITNWCKSHAMRREARGACAALGRLDGEESSQCECAGGSGFAEAQQAFYDDTATT